MTTARLTEAEIIEEYKFLGTSFLLIEDGGYSNNDLITVTNPPAVTNIAYSLINLSDQPLFFVRPDGLMGSCHSGTGVLPTSTVGLKASEQDALRNAVGRINAAKGVLIKISPSNRAQYQLLEKHKTSFITFSSENLKSIPFIQDDTKFKGFTYYIHVPDTALLETEGGVFVPHIGYTFSRYTDLLRNRYLETTGKGPSQVYLSTGWQFVLDASPTSHKELIVALGTNFEKIQSRNRRDASETIMVYKNSGTTKAELVKTIPIADALEKPITFTHEGKSYYFPIFTNQSEADVWYKTEAGVSMSKYKEVLSKSEQLEIDLAKELVKNKKLTEEAEKAKKSAADSKWNIVGKIASIAAPIIGLVKILIDLYLKSKNK